MKIALLGKAASAPFGRHAFAISRRKPPEAVTARTWREVDAACMNCWVQTLSAIVPLELG